MKSISSAIWLIYILSSYQTIWASVGGRRPDQDVAATTCVRSLTGTRPPVASKRPTVLKTAAGAVVDDFHWLRDDKHQDPEVLNYLAAENAYSNAAFQQLEPLAAQLAREMESRLSHATAPLPVRHGQWWYYERQDPQQRFWVRYRRAVVQATTADGSLQDQDYEPAWVTPAASSSSDVGRQAAPDQLVLDPNYECEQHIMSVLSKPDDSSNSHSSSKSSPENCDVWGSTVSPDGQLVAFGIDASGSEQYQLVVRQIGSNKAMLSAPIPDTSGDYEWAADSRSLFYVTRSNTTNRPDQVWFIRLGQPNAFARLLWQEDNPAFYLSISCSSSGRFLLLSSASEVTRQVLVLDLVKYREPSSSEWVELAARHQGVQQQQVGHWQDWLFMLLVSPETPNGELRVAHITSPHHHMVLLPHRREVELEDVRILSHHLVLQERQLGHTTITVYCLPANSSEAAQAACRYNSTAASAAEALADAKAEQKQGSSAAAAVSSTSSSSNDMAGSMGLEIESFQLQLDDDSSSDVAYEKQEVTDAPELDLTDPEQLMDSLALVESSTGSSMGDVHRQSGTFLVIRGRAGSITEAGEGSLHLTDPAVAVEEQQHMQKQQGQQQSIEQRRNQEQSKEQRGKQQQQSGKQQRRQQRRQQPQQQARQRLSDAGNKANQAAANTAAPAAQNPSSNGKSKAPPAANSKGSLNKAAAVKVPKPSSSSTASSTSSSKPDTPQPPMLSSENSWQVAFEEDAYSVSIMDTGDWSHPMLRLSYTSFTTPQSVIDIDMFTQRRVVRSVAEVGGGFRSEAYRSYRLWVPAYDGVEVPLSLVYRLDSFGRNGLNPALLMVYGAYGTKYDPEFDSRLLSLLDRGWLVGIAHVRGGGELGYRWHDDGRLESKTNSFTDLLACAQALITHNMTSASRLAVWGRSAGGLTAGAAINTAPQLFGSAVMDVPFLDVLGDLVDAELPLTVKEWEEWGNPRVNATLAALIASYSPVQNVNPQAVYPHMMITTGLQDTRVGYWEAAKWVAQLRAAAAAGTAQQRKQRLLLRTDPTGGHVSAGASSSIGEAAVKYAFLIATLPSCGSPEGLTGPDVQQPAAAVAAVQSAASKLNSMVAESMAALRLLPAVVQKLLLLLMAVGVAAAALTVVWHASRVWLPAALNPAEVAAALDLGIEAGPAADYSNLYSSSKASHATAALSSRDVSRRVSTAATAGTLSERQQLLLHHKRSSTSGGAELSSSPARLPPQLQLSTSGGNGGLSRASSGPPSSGVGTLFSPSFGVQQQQQQLVFGGLVDDFLLDLTSGVPSSSRPSYTSEHRQPSNHSWHNAVVITDVDAGTAYANYSDVTINRQHSTGSTNSGTSAATLRPLSRTAERRTSTGF